MLRKFLFVGLGGSGGKTLRFLRSELSNWLTSIGWKAPLPVGWQMLHIDTPTRQDGREITEVPMLPAENYLGLVLDGIDFKAVAARVQQQGDSEAWTDLSGWRVDPTFLQVPITTGAGQFRAVGRTIGLAYADQILHHLRTAHGRLSTASAGGELAEISKLAYGTEEPPPGEPVIVVISSLAGGTGAGLLLDVCDLLRQLPGQAGDNTFGVLYASDVFHRLGTMATSGVYPNALAALSELMNGYWLTPNFPRLSPVLAAAGAPAPIGRSGPAFPFLVGAANAKGVSFGDQREVYAMMGRAIRGWTTDPTVQDRLVAYTMANWMASAMGNTVQAPVLMADHQPIFEAFGYAEVSIGMDRFERYATTRLARNTAIWLLQAHVKLALQADPNENREPDDIAQDVAREQLLGFLRTVELNERGQDDQVIDALRPPAAESELSQIQDAIEDELSGIGKALPAASWLSRISEAVIPYADQFAGDYDMSLRAQAESWVASMEERLPRATLEVVSRFGLDVGASLLQLVAQEIAAVVSELHDEANERLRWAADIRSAISSKLQAGGNIPANNVQVSEAVWEGLYVGAFYRSEARLRQVAQSLLTQLASGLIEPLERSLRLARHELHELGFVGDGITEPVVETWPDISVPSSLLPPKNEFLVVDPDQFPMRFDRLLVQAAGADTVEAGFATARSSVITGDFLDEADASDLGPLETRQRWLAEMPAIGLTGRPPQPALLRARMSPAEILARATAWISRPSSAFERFIGEDLRSFLDENPTLPPGEVSERRAHFRQALTAAFDAAEPLVRINMGLYALLHNRAQMPRRAVPSLLPFRDHPVEDSVRQIIASALGPGDTWNDAFTTSRNITSISISSTLGAAHDPLVFASIMEPIVAGWNAARLSPPLRTNFWENRRARPISEFVPASHEVLLAMTRGWFTALMLGRLDKDNFKIIHDGLISEFPRTLLREPASDRDRLPAVLESLGLAYAEVAKLESLEPIRPYVALRELGSQQALAHVRQAGVYEQVNQDLRTWILTGDAGQPLVKPVVERSAERDLASARPAERRQAALALVEKVRDDYSAKLHEYRERAQRDPSALGSNYGIWPGMHPLLDRALADLRAALLNLELDDAILM